MEEIYKEYSKLVYNYLFSLTNDIELSEELMQETFYSAIKNIDKFNYTCKISVWLCQIAKNKYIDEVRKSKKTEIISLDDNINEYIKDILIDVESKMILEEQEKIVYKILNKYDEEIRKLFYMRIKLNLTFKEIYQILGRSEEWARVTFFRIKIKIKEELENEK